MASSRLELISKKLIKPSISTPAALRNYKLSITDQLMANIYIPFSFFYLNKDTNSSPSSNIVGLLENSLSKVLTSYYPFAGRLAPGNLNIDCNDMGATLIEARLNCKISEISRHSNNDNVQDMVFPSGFPWKTKHDQSLLVAQLTHFDCGGKAVSLCLSHKVADGLTLCHLSSHWAAITRLPGDYKSSPQLNAASIFPPIEDPSTKPESCLLGEAGNNVTKRYVFYPTRLSQLKAKASAETFIQNPTRVEVVTALLHKCADAATSIVHPNTYKPPVFSQAINIRPLLDPPMSSNSVGNLLDFLQVPFPDGMKDLSVSKVVSQLRRAKVEFYEKVKGLTTANEFRKHIIESAQDLKILQDEDSDFDVYSSSSVCRFPFYETDFGWGNPDKVSFGTFPHKNVVVLMDDLHGGGIEALVSLEDQVMNIFETDPALLEFASTTSNNLA